MRALSSACAALSVTCVGTEAPAAFALSSSCTTAPVANAFSYSCAKKPLAFWRSAAACTISFMRAMACCRAASSPRLARRAKYISR